MKTDGVPDTVSAARTQSGHALVDLGLHVQPNPNLEVMGMIRVRNDFGGFWGSGVTFDLRQLWVRGVIADIIRFQLGDIDYRMSPYTFRNEDEWILGGTSTVSQTSLDMLRYDIFQNDQETWRQQGLAMDFGFQFKKLLNEVNFSLFTTRTNSADFGGSDRLYGGGMMDLQVAKEWHLLYRCLCESVRHSGNLCRPRTAQQSGSVHRIEMEPQPQEVRLVRQGRGRTIAFGVEG